MQIKTKPSNQNFVKRRARQLVPFLIVGVVKNQRLSAEAIFTQKKKICILLYLQKPWWNSITVRLMQIPEKSLKEIDFSTRNALDCFQRECLNCHLGRIIKKQYRAQYGDRLNLQRHNRDPSTHPNPPLYQYNARSPSLNERAHILGDTHSYFFEADRSFAWI